MLPSYTMMKQQHPLGSKPLEKSKVLDEGKREKKVLLALICSSRV